MIKNQLTLIELSSVVESFKIDSNSGPETQVSQKPFIWNRFVPIVTKYPLFMIAASYKYIWIQQKPNAIIESPQSEVELKIPKAIYNVYVKTVSQKFVSKIYKNFSGFNAKLYLYYFNQLFGNHFSQQFLVEKKKAELWIFE